MTIMNQIDKLIDEAEDCRKEIFDNSRLRASLRNNITVESDEFKKMARLIDIRNRNLMADLENTAIHMRNLIDNYKEERKRCF